MHHVLLVSLPKTEGIAEFITRRCNSSVLARKSNRSFYQTYVARDVLKS